MARNVLKEYSLTNAKSHDSWQNYTIPGIFEILQCHIYNDKKQVFFVGNPDINLLNNFKTIENQDPKGNFSWKCDVFYDISYFLCLLTMALISRNAL